jgi:hypothetical protein
VIAALRSRGLWKTAGRQEGRFPRKVHRQLPDDPDPGALKRTEAALAITGTSSIACEFHIFLLANYPRLVRGSPKSGNFSTLYARTSLRAHARATGNRYIPDMSIGVRRRVNAAGKFNRQFLAYHYHLVG